MFFIVAVHEDIFARLKAHDADGAEQTIKVHLISVVRELDLIRKAHPEYFASDR